MKSRLSKTVWVLSLVSLFTDMASEMLYPVMPAYLKSIGFSVIAIGVLEGIAEAVAGLSKGYFGSLSDARGRRVPFVRAGYTLSALSKPMLALSAALPWIFISRSLDRLGKGLRTGARDAILSSESDSSNKASVFGFHRSMDTLGAFVGPLMAMAYLYYYPSAYKNLFFIAAVPGFLAIALTWFLREKQRTAPPGNKPHLTAAAFYSYFKTAPGSYRRVVAALLVFALFNSSDVFLLLKLKESGYSDTLLLAAYIFYNAIYALAAWPLGMLADKLGPRLMLGAGLFLFALTYTGFAFASRFEAFVGLFFLYGLYAAATEGVSKAWISLLVDEKDTGAAIGTYSGFQSIATLLASSIAGLIWFYTGPSAVFIISALGAGCVAIYMLIALRK